MSTLATFGLCEAVPDTSFNAEWQTLIQQQAQVLGTMLQRLLGAAQRQRQRHTTTRLQTLAVEAERLLTMQAQQHVVLERDLPQRRVAALTTDAP